MPSAASKNASGSMMKGVPWPMPSSSSRSVIATPAALARSSSYSDRVALIWVKPVGPPSFSISRRVT